MKSVMVGVAAIAVAMLGGCESLLTGGPLVREGEPTGTVNVVNGSNRTVIAVLISDCGASTYGLNRMVKDETIAPGGKREFTVSAGCWDVDAGTQQGDEKRERVQVPAGGLVTYTFTVR